MPDFCSSGSAPPPAPTKTNFALILRVSPVRRLRIFTVQLPSDSCAQVADLVTEQRGHAVLHAV